MRQLSAHSDPDSRTTISPETDPARWGHSLANAIEIVTPLLDAAAPADLAEVGAYAGDLTERLLEWSRKSGTKITAIDPLPAPGLVDLAKRDSQLDLIERPSHDALAEMKLPDALVIDGDHNYFTVAEECRIIGERADEAGGHLPLLIFHDVGWPHARRDTYYKPEAIPEDRRQEIVDGGALFPGESSVTDAGLPYRWPATHEGGPENGVLTAIEDFVEGRGNLSFAVIPVFFGVGVVWDPRAEYAADLDRLTGPYDRNPVLERLEANRTFHLASEYVQRVIVGEQQGKLARMEAFLEELSKSSTFAMADRVAARGDSERSWRHQIRLLIDGQ